MLELLEHNPHALFYQQELVKRFPAEFDSAVESRILKHEPLEIKEGFVGYYAHEQRSTLAVVCFNDRLEAFDEDDPEFDPIGIEITQLARWSLNLTTIARRMQDSHGLRGQPGPLNDRLFFVGTKDIDGMRMAAVIGLLDSDANAQQSLRGLCNFLPERYDRYLVLCPTFVPTPVTARELASFDVEVLPFWSEQPLEAAMSRLRSLSAGRRRVVLSDTEVAESRQHYFKSQLPIHITSRVERRSSIIVMVDGASVPLQLAEFRFFLRLVQALFDDPAGYLSWDAVRLNTESEEIGEVAVAPEGLEQALSRLRGRLRPALGGLRGNQFIERRQGRIRISTHRRYVTYDRNGLLRHDDGIVRKLASKLPDDPAFNLSS